jgi:uracil-DNA glycosylase family 4
MIALKILEEKNRILLRMKHEVADCIKCKELCLTRNQTVFGKGNPNAKILLLGEAAGREEDQTGIPFVGRAGQLLDNILKSCGWSLDDVYICNVIKCRPPQNRLPSPEEIENCSGFLRKQIEVVNPKFIVCLGSVASQALVGLPVGKAREKWHVYENYDVICSYHPAYLLRNPAAKELVWKDLQPLIEVVRSKNVLVQGRNTEEHSGSSK